MTLTSRSQTTKRQTPDTKGEKRLALIGVGDLGCGCGGVLSIGIGIGDCDYPLPAGPFLSTPAHAAAGKIVLEEKKHGRCRETARRAKPRCLVASITRASWICGFGYLGWWV